MGTAKVKIKRKRIFNKIKASLSPYSYVECGLCGAIRVEVNEVARVISSFINHHNSIHVS